MPERITEARMAALAKGYHVGTTAEQAALLRWLAEPPDEPRSEDADLVRLHHERIAALENLMRTGDALNRPYAERLLNAY